MESEKKTLIKSVHFLIPLGAHFVANVPVTGVGAGKVWGMRRIFARISTNVPEKTPKRIMTSKKTTTFHEC